MNQESQQEQKKTVSKVQPTFSITVLPHDTESVKYKKGSYIHLAFFSDRLTYQEQSKIEIERHNDTLGITELVEKEIVLLFDAKRDDFMFCGVVKSNDGFYEMHLTGGTTNVELSFKQFEKAVAVKNVVTDWVFRRPHNPAHLAVTVPKQQSKQQRVLKAVK